jgi:CRP/FNR family cyclic AMP-dependent transcriptional regulator
MKRRGPRDYHALLRTGRWFAALPEPLQAQLLDGAILRSAAAGERILSRGDEPKGMFCVVDGAIRVFGDAGASREPLYMIVEPPSWLGELSVIDGLPRPHNATADVASELIHVPQPAIDAILAAEPRYWRDFALLVAQRLRLAMLALEDSSLSPPLVRAARRLALMIDGYGDHTHQHRSVELSQEQLATMINVSRQTVNQLLKELEALGMVKLAYGEIEIVDVAALQRLASLAP